MFRACGLLLPLPTCMPTASPASNGWPFLLPCIPSSTHLLRPCLHSSHPRIISLPTGLQSFVGSEPGTHSHAVTASASFWGEREAGKHSWALFMNTPFLQPSLTPLWSCFHGDRTWCTVCSIYLLEMKYLWLKRRVMQSLCTYSLLIYTFVLASISAWCCSRFAAIVSLLPRTARWRAV